ncbi:MAG: O-antigen ligase family protein, partial [Anaerolineae bacterium]|nr:O-antigen ligase family protein [Anaerolineae bacterium]
ILLALLLVILLDIQSDILILVLTTGLIGLWLAGAVLEPFSLLLSALALAGTVSEFSSLSISNIPFSVNGLLVAALGAAAGLSVVVHYRQQFRTGRQIRRWLLDSAPLVLFLGWAMVRTLDAPSLVNAISDLLIWASIACVYTLARAYWIAEPQRIQAGEMALVYTALLPLAVIVVDALLGNVFFNNTTTALSLGIHTTLGVRLVPSLFGLLLAPISVQLRVERKQATWQKWILIALTVFLCVWIFFSLSRLVLITAAGIVVPFALFQPRSLWKAALMAALGMALSIVVIASPLYPRPLFVSLDSIFVVDANDNAGEGAETQLNSEAMRGLSFGRTNVWEYLVRTALAENLLTGHGTGAARDYVQNAAPSWDNPHSDYIRIFFDLGLIGLAIFACAWAYKILRLWHTWLRFAPQSPVARRTFTAFIGVGYILVSFLTDNFLVYFFMMGPLSLLLALADAERIHVEMHPETEL